MGKHKTDPAISTYNTVKKMRGNWGAINPITKVIPNKKKDYEYPIDYYEEESMDRINNYQDIRCPVCGSHKDHEIVSDDNDLHTDFNFNAYYRTVHCYCDACGTAFDVHELYDIVGYDPDSITVVE